MALPTLAEAKAYLRVDTSAEDTVITDLLASAQAWAESLLGFPITAEQRTVDVPVTAYDAEYRNYFYLGYPVASSPAIVITDANGDTVSSGTYTVDSRSGRVLANSGSSFSATPFSIVATVGLSAHPDYATKKEPILRSLIFGLTSILYRQRNPDVTSESAGGGESTSYEMNEIPSRLRAFVHALKGPRISA